jgi:ABC-type branched-subunit amino acid transport system ATPase component
MMESLLEVRQLTVEYRGAGVVVRHVDLECAAGEIRALLGPNGAGKTSTARGITGFLRRESGRVRSGSVSLGGEAVTGKSPYHLARAGLCLVPERDKVFVGLTVRDHLRLAEARHAGLKASGATAHRWSVSDALDLFPRLRPHLPHPAGYLSGGERQMLAIATALVRSPRLLIVDEMTQGLSASVVAEISRILPEVRAAGVGILLIEQSVNVALDLAEYVYVIDGGELVLSGLPEEEGVLALRSGYSGLGAR